MTLPPLGILAAIRREAPLILLPKRFQRVPLQATGRAPLAVHLRIQTIVGLYPTATPANIRVILP